MDRRSFLSTLATTIGGVFVPKQASGEKIHGSEPEAVLVEEPTLSLPPLHKVIIEWDNGDKVLCTPISISCDYYRDMIDVTSDGHYVWVERKSRRGITIRKREFKRSLWREYVPGVANGSLSLKLAMHDSHYTDAVKVRNAILNENHKVTVVINVDSKYISIPCYFKCFSLACAIGEPMTADITFSAGPPTYL